MLFRPLSPGILPKQNLEISVTSTPSVDTNPKLINAAARPKQSTAALILQQQTRVEVALKRCPYNLPLGKSVTNELPPKWAKMRKCPAK